MDSRMLVGLALRHFGTLAAGWLISKGYVDSSMSDAVIGTVVGAGAVAASVLEKKKRD